MGTWFSILRPGMTCPMIEGGPSWCHVPHLSFPSSNFPSARPLASASYLPSHHGSAPCAGGDLGSPFSSSVDPAVQGPSWPRRGAILWAGWHSANWGGKGSGTAGCQTSSEGSSFRLLLPGVTLWDCRLDLVPFRFHETTLVSKSLSCPYQNGKGCAGAGCPSLACCSHSGGWGGAGWYV